MSDKKVVVEADLPYHARRDLELAIGMQGVRVESPPRLADEYGEWKRYVSGMSNTGTLGMAITGNPLTAAALPAPPAPTMTNAQLQQIMNAKMAALNNIGSSTVSQGVYDPGDHTDMGKFTVEKIDNGYLVRYARRQHERTSTVYAIDLKEAGEKITSICVKHELQGT